MNLKGAVGTTKSTKDAKSDVEQDTDNLTHRPVNFSLKWCRILSEKIREARTQSYVLLFPFVLFASFVVNQPPLFRMKDSFVVQSKRGTSGDCLKDRLNARRLWCGGVAEGLVRGVKR
jgi:hypothetical protein